MKNYIKNKAIWKTPSVDPNRDFVYEAQCLSGPGEKNWDIDLLRQSNLHRETGDETSDFKTNVACYENGSDIILRALWEQKPTTRTTALQIIKDFYGGRSKDQPHPWAEMESYMRYQHYAAEIGFDMVGCEIGCCMAGYPVSMAFTRGAARQFGKAYFSDFSLWGAGTDGIGGNMLNYSGNFYAFNGTGEAKINNPEGGQGVNAVERSHLYMYQSGISWLINEAGGNAAFWTEKDNDGYYKITPHGRVFQKIYDYTKRHADRGINYTPFGLVVDYYHGFPFGLWNGNKIFESIEPNAGDLMTQGIFSMFFPHWNEYVKLARNQLVSTPYGDTLDVLLQNASQEVLNSYPILILSGDIRFDSTEVERYRNYVAQGGILVLNTAYLTAFPEWKKETNDGRYELSVGAGKVLVFGGNYEIAQLPQIVAELSEQFFPFRISGDVHYFMNVRENSLVLTVMNHNGVTKESDKLEVFDDTEAQNIMITYCGSDALKSVKELMTDTEMTYENGMTFPLKPGSYVVLEFEF